MPNLFVCKPNNMLNVLEYLLQMLLRQITEYTKQNNKLLTIPANAKQANCRKAKQ